ncbi:MAG: hypothetical protein AAGM33_11150, partial [Pseudomonadota bacterium]
MIFSKPASLLRGIFLRVVRATEQKETPMNLKDKTTLIQHELLRRGQKLPRFGTDGDYGTEMADALIVELGIKPAQSGLFEGIITGTGENISRIF